MYIKERRQRRNDDEYNPQSFGGANEKFKKKKGSKRDNKDQLQPSKS